MNTKNNNDPFKNFKIEKNSDEYRPKHLNEEEEPGKVIRKIIESYQKNLKQ